MADNGAPKLIYSPDNDTDDYTQVVAYINEEFLRIQEEEAKELGESPKKIAQENERSDSVENQIIRILMNNPEVTRIELAAQLGISADSVKYRLDKLRTAGRIAHQGSTKAGKWVVLKP